MDSSDPDILRILVTEDQLPTPGPDANLEPWLRQCTVLCEMTSGYFCNEADGESL